MLGGLSLGAQIALEILSRRSGIANFAVIESALVIPSKLTAALTKPMIGMSHWLIKKKWFAKLQFSYLRIKKELFDAYYKCTCSISKEDMISFLKANSTYHLKNGIEKCCAQIYPVVGEKEGKQMKLSAKLIGEKLGRAPFIVPKLHHGEFSINHAGEYAQMLKKILNNAE